MRFFVVVRSKVDVFSPIAVEASTPEEAKEKAQKLATSSKFPWASKPAAEGTITVSDCDLVDPTDSTEFVRRAMTLTLNEAPMPRHELEEAYGKVWDTKELQEDFDVMGFLAPFAHVRRKSDRKVGSITFQHEPRYYFDFKEGP